jgi:hypothetical protein
MGRSWQGGIGVQSRSSQPERPVPPGQGHPHVPHAAERAVCDQTIEERFQQAKDQVGRDHDQVRRWPGWYRHHTLALLAHAVLVVTHAKATTGEGAKGGRGRLTGGLGLLPLTVPEVRRLLVALGWTTPIQPGLVLAWSRCADASRPAPDAHTTSDTNKKCS